MKDSSSGLIISAVILSIASVFLISSQVNVGSISSNFQDLDALGSKAPELDAETAETDSVNLQQGLKAYYRFDDPKVSRGNSIEFDGVDDYIEVSDSESLDSAFGETFNFTLTAWVKIEEWEDWRAIQNKASCGSWSCTTAGLWAYEGGLVTVMGSDEGGNPDGSYVRADYKSSLNRWHHAAAVGNGSHVKLYVDGELRDTNTITDYIKANLTSNNEPLVLGRRCAGCVESTNGSIARIKTFNRTLSEEEISRLYRSKPVSDEGLVLSMDMDSRPSECDLTGSQTCIKDDSGYSNNGKPVNFDYSGFVDPAGWEDETPVNRLSFRNYAGLDEARAFSQNSASLQGFNFSQSSSWLSEEGDSMLRFDGVDDSINVPDTGSLRQALSGEEATIAFWVDLGNLTGSWTTWFPWTAKNSEYRGARLENTGSEDNIYVRWIVDPKSAGSNTGDGGTWARGLPDLQEQKFLHVSTFKTTDSGYRVRTYINDTIESEYVSNERAVLGNASNIGNFRPREDVHDIDDLMFYDRELSPKEVSNLYEGRVPREGLVGEYRMNEGERKTLFDTAATSRPGIVETEGVEIGERVNKIYSGDLTSLKKPFTFSTWLKHEGDSESEAILSQAKFNSISYSQDIDTSYSDWSNYCGQGETNYNLRAPDNTDTATSIKVRAGEDFCDRVTGRIQSLSTKVGKTYTASIWVKGKEGGESFRLGLDDGNMCSYTLSDDWDRYSCTLEAVQTDRGFQFFGTDANTTYRVWGAQRRPGEYSGLYTSTRGNPVNKTGINVWTEDGGLIYEYRTSKNHLSLETQITDNKWSQIAVERGQKSMRLYVGGELRDEGDLLGKSDGDQAVIGGSVGENITSFEGRLDELRIYNRTLTQEEIQRLNFG